jgi:hypothetical protein
MDKNQKKPWIRPQLIVVLRGAREESVLLGCKGFHTGGPYTTCSSLSGNCSDVVAS